VSLRGAAAARDQLTAARTVLAQNPGLGVLRKQIELLDAEIDLLLGQDGRELGLTSAELRVLPLLTTHLSFREIASRLYVSRNTVKTQAISIYRKLGASTRSEAIEKAERLGLLDARLSA
jgi:LuxR family maltose regulon positive regulatory protein